MKRILCLLLAFALPFACLTQTHAQEAQPLNLIATVFPAFDFARVLTQGTADVRLLLPPGSESHSYEPTPQDIIAIQSADLFIYVGGESDHWIEEMLASMGDAAPRVFRLADCVTLLNEPHSESMQHDHNHEHAHEHADEQQTMDEHVWTSPRNAMLIVEALCHTLCELRPANADLYRAAQQDYDAQLHELDAAFVQTVQQGKRDLIVFGDRFPLRYFAAAYGLHYDAAFPGCSEDSEPSVKTVISLVDKVRAQNIPVVFYIEFSSRKTADILAEETGAKPMLFHSCHNVSAADIEAGVSYLSLMWNNVSVLKEALN